MTSKPSVLVVGAGPTGLTAAVELARRGFRPRIIDKDDGPTPLSKAVGVSARSLEILEPSGVAGRLLDRGVQVNRVRIRSGDQELGVIEIAALPHRFNFLLSLPQSETETQMAEVLRARGAEVEWRTALTDLDVGDGGAQAVLDGPAGREAARFDYVFGADGVHSRVREACGIGFEGRTHSRLWSIADVEIEGWPYQPDAAQVFLHENGDVGFIIPMGPARFRAVSNTPDAMSRIGGEWTLSRLLRTDTFHIPIRQAATYQVGNVFLGGDAAHVHSPVGARGMNLGIEDAASFVRRLVEGDLDGYTAERRPVGRRWIKLSERLLGAAQTTSPTAAAIRNFAFRIVGHSPALQRQVLDRISGLRE